MPPVGSRMTPPPGAPRPDALALAVPRFCSLLPAGAVLTDPAQLSTYRCDGLTHYAATPGCVVLPETATQVRDVVRTCVELGLPYVARGAGTGLSGGALPRTDGVLVVTSRMRRIVEVDAVNLRARVQPGVANLEVTRAVEPHGLYYAPDPSSQQVCSIGGNVAENSGGAHCLKYGFTTHHVLGVELVTPEGELVQLGGATAQSPGYDLVGVVVGSEGTLGIVTEVTLRLMPQPEQIRTLLAGFAGTSPAGHAVSAIIAAGVVPAAIEMMDALAIEAAEACVGCGYPPGAGAVLIVEVDGPGGEVESELADVIRLCREHGAGEIRVAQSPQERADIWRGRKSAFAAVGRISPDYIVQDGVVPRSRLPELLAAIADLAAGTGIRVANVFHAGDGNLHPLVLFDERIPGQGDRAEELAGQILDLCIAADGSITGEHGVGVDKAAYMPRMFTPADLETMQLVRAAFDPLGLCNPGKIFPTPRLCGEVPGRHRASCESAWVGAGELF